MNSYPIKQFRLEHGYDFELDLRGPQISSNDLIIGLSSESKVINAVYLGKVAEYNNMRLNAWLDTNGAHAVYIMGKRRSGKSYSLGVFAENLASSQWIRQGTQKQAVLLLDTMNVFTTMPYNVEEIHKKDSNQLKELRKWGLSNENLLMKIFYPRGTPKPPEGDSQELSIKACDLNAEDWASLFGVDTYSDPIGQFPIIGQLNFLRPTDFPSRGRRVQRPLDHPIRPPTVRVPPLGIPWIQTAGKL